MTSHLRMARSSASFAGKETPEKDIMSRADASDTSVEFYEKVLKIMIGSGMNE
jgi:hypothetical protein